MAGIVEELGSLVTELKKGDRVMSLLPGGGYAQYVSIPEKIAVKIPDEIDFETAAGIPEAFITAFQTLFTIGNIKPYQKVLIHAGASGVGTSAIQLCNLVEGVQTFITTSSIEKIDECLKLGAHAGVNYKEGPWLEKMLKITNGGVDIIIDCIGANYFNDNLQVLKLDGKLILIGFLSGSVLKGDFSMAPILGKRLTIQGTTLRSRSLEYKIQLTKDFASFSEGKLGKQLRPIISKILNWEDVAKAHDMMENNKNVGKIILKVN